MTRRSFVRRHPKLILVGGPIALVGVLLAVLLAELQYARSREYAVDSRFELERSFPGDGPTIELGVVGDSTVAGLGVDDVDDTLPVQVGLELAARTGRPVRVRGYGVSGATIGSVLDQQLVDVPTDLDVLVFEVGSNDVTHMTRLEQVEQRTRRLIDAGRRHAPIVVLGTAGRLDTTNFKRPLRDIVMARASQVRARQLTAAHAESIGVVEIGGSKVGDEFNATKDAVSFDGFHPARAGYGVWARALAQEIAHQLDRVKSPA